MGSDRLEESLEIDRASAEEIVRIINLEDRKVATAVAAASESIARAIDAITERLTHGGRMFYVGAGTSGRLAMVDASELPPTFGVDAGLVQVIIAGGREAFFSAVEGAEDDEEEAVAEVLRCVTPDDCVVGIAASGRTPFTVAAVRRANLQGALTVGVSGVREAPLTRECDIPIVIETGPEVILGSSRMKAGTAQKLVLNTISTGVMIRLGKVYSNLMVEMPPTNEKLRARAISMVEIAAGVPRTEAFRLYEDSGRDTKVAILMANRKCGAADARALLERSGGNLREALGA
jgi:N-acetylmuramic acid 6-phosphate etherase